jgi:hypothetical protein
MCAMLPGHHAPGLHTGPLLRCWWQPSARLTPLLPPCCLPQRPEVQPELVATLEHLVRCSVAGIRLCAVAVAEALVPSVGLELITRRVLPSLTTLLYRADDEVRGWAVWVVPCDRSSSQQC